MTNEIKTKCCNGKSCHSSQDLTDAPATDERTFSPRVDIFETENELVLECEMPGVNSDDLDIRFENQDLEIRGKVKNRFDDEEFLRQEYRVGSFYRAFSLGDSINSEGIEAELADGLLTLRLPKHQAAKPRRIKVKAV